VFSVFVEILSVTRVVRFGSFYGSEQFFFSFLNHCLPIDNLIFPFFFSLSLPPPPLKVYQEKPSMSVLFYAPTRTLYIVFTPSSALVRGSCTILVALFGHFVVSPLGHPGLFQYFLESGRLSSPFFRGNFF